MATLIPHALTDLNRLRDLMSPSTSFPSGNRDMLIHIINSVSRYILTRTHLRTPKYYSLTEVLDGKGLDRLVTRYWPIISITSIHDDTNRNYDAATLIAATDYEIYNHNTVDPIPNSGIVRHLCGVFENQKSNIQIIYTAGLSVFEIQTGANDQIIVNEGGSDITVTLDMARYDASSLATELAAKLNAHASTSNTYTVTYSSVSHRYNIAVGSGETLTLAWTTSGTRHTELGTLIGFDVSVDDSGAENYTSNYPVLGIPEDLIDVASSLVRWRYAEMDERRIGKFSESRTESSMSFDYSNIPSYIIDSLQPYQDILM